MKPHTPTLVAVDAPCPSGQSCNCLRDAVDTNFINGYWLRFSTLLIITGHKVSPESQCDYGLVAHLVYEPYHGHN